MNSRAFRQAGSMLVWFILVIAVGLGLAVYWYYQPHSAPDWVREPLSRMTQTTAPLYRWQDERGQWQITDRPPQGRPYETVIYRRDANVMPAEGSGKRP